MTSLRRAARGVLRNGARERSQQISLVSLRAAQRDFHRATSSLASATHALVDALTAMQGTADLIVDRFERAARQLGAV